MYNYLFIFFFFFFSSRRRHTRWTGDWSSDVCSSDLQQVQQGRLARAMWPDHGHQLASVRLQRHVVEHAAAVLAGEAHVLEREGASTDTQGPRWLCCAVLGVLV